MDLHPATQFPPASTAAAARNRQDPRNFPVVAVSGASEAATTGTALAVRRLLRCHPFHPGG
ncbi:hypothetical protein ABZ356_19510, partial [Micromonospora zamorensis]